MQRAAAASSSGSSHAARKPGPAPPSHHGRAGRGGGWGGAAPGIGCLSSACVMELIAGAWVSAYHAAFRGSVSVEHEEAEVRMSLIQHDLGTCAQRLYAREADLDARMQELTHDAVARKRSGDVAGAKRRLVERKRVQGQRDAVSSSLSVVEMHISTIEGTELNRSILETLRASGDALRRLGAASGGIEEVEKIVSDVEQQVDAAGEITRVIHSANVAGTLNTMGGEAMTEAELEAELEELLTLGDPPSEAWHERLPPAPEATLHEQGARHNKHRRGESIGGAQGWAEAALVGGDAQVGAQQAQPASAQEGASPYARMAALASS